LRIWEVATGRLVAVKQFTKGVGIVATFSPDGDRVYVEDASGRLKTFDRATLRQLDAGVPVATGSSVTALSARGDSVLVVKLDGSFVRVRPETGEFQTEAPSGTLTDTNSATNDLSPDGNLLATTDASHWMGLLNVETLEWVGADAAADSRASAGGWVTFAPDGSQFASLQINRIALWDGRTGEYVGSLPIPELATGGSIRYLPDSSGLLVAARDGRTWVADTRSDSWPQRACAIAGRNLTASEWQQFFPSRRYEATCPQWPAGT
jgi:WD40 repeat protein